MVASKYYRRHTEGIYKVSYVYLGSLKNCTFTSPTVLLESIAKYITKEINLKYINNNERHSRQLEIRELVCLDF